MTSEAPPPQRPERTVRATSVPYVAGTEGYASFRIPAVVVTAGGTLLAFAEGRRASDDDFGDIDIVLRRSTDGGAGWGPMTVVAANGDDLAGNPAPIATADGRVVLVEVFNAAAATEDAIRRGRVSAADGRRVYVQHSDDEGATWSASREITETTKRPEWRWYATTPGHAIELREAPHTGRLVVPANHSVPPTGGDNGTEGRYNGGHDLLSDDGGETWRLGYTDDNTDGYVNVNETTAAELPDGRVYFNTRNDSPSPGNRADAYSADGGATLELPFRPQAGLVAPVVEASVLQLRDPDLLLFSAPADPDSRALMTVRASTDGGVTWRSAYTVDGLPAAYSDLVRIDADTVGLLYETGDFSAYSTISFLRIPISDLTL
ncbi:exo-alpha-sialidase [Streptomyces armeniacus]|uniref:exo-alpha-sialidase n=1 Tax=Streptomyces armeniacus TaxID=83291 RepID=A0A345XPK8_9ACTN|nr:sialidase family protein [Streptomyces armeniacus]AXK33574.1 exo-alpha-sialidase [Streptomyces armeniacus]